MRSTYIIFYNVFYTLRKDVILNSELECFVLLVYTRTYQAVITLVFLFNYLHFQVLFRLII